METISENIINRAGYIRTKFHELLFSYSSIYYWNTDDGGLIIITPTPYAYKDLPNEGKLLQSQIRKEYEDYYSLLSILLRDLPEEVKRELSLLDRYLRDAIEQRNTADKNIEEAYNEIEKAISNQITYLSSQYDPTDGNYLFIPDTNALLHNPEIESWNFPGINCFVLVLLPTVLSELDEAKINHKNEVVREKAEKIIRKIKEYRRRGNILDCVPIVNEKIYLTAIAVEPNMNGTLSWLEKNNHDDKIIASILEVMHDHPRSIITFVSRDINVQNKAQLACIPYAEPPE
jgi:hypothetical protein